MPFRYSYNRFERLRVIHFEISRNTHPDWKVLAEVCIRKLDLPSAVHSLRRTIYDDLNCLRNIGAPIVSKRGKYHYSEEFSLDEIINPDEVTLLQNIQILFKQYATLPTFKGFEPILKQLEERTGPIPKLIELEHNEHYTGLKHLWPLYEAMMDKRALSIHYQDFKGNKSQHTLSPYRFREYNNRWYLCGLDHEQDYLVNLALDRIVSIGNSLFTFKPSKQNLDRYYADIVGVTRYRDAEPEHVRIRVQKPRAYYLTTKPLHRSQHIIEQADESMVLGYRLIPNPELVAELLSLGPDCEVLAPEPLRERLRTSVAKMHERYG